jgi:hypothetical protein
MKVRIKSIVPTLATLAAAAALAAPPAAAAPALPGSPTGQALAQDCRDLALGYTFESYGQFGGGNAFTIQFYQRACWDGNTVQWKIGPDIRTGAPEDSRTTISACTVSATSPVNSPDTSVRTTCSATVKNILELPGFLQYRPTNRNDDNSNFKLSAGESTTRTFSVLVDRNGCVQVSGVGQGGLCQ